MRGIGWAALVCVACSGGGDTNDSGPDSTTNTDATIDTGVMDTGGKETGMDTGAMDSGSDATLDTGSDAPSDTGTDVTADAIADAGPDVTNACWMGSKTQCFNCCLAKLQGNSLQLATAVGMCLCGGQVCGTQQACANDVCQQNGYSAGCQSCIGMNYTANGPCMNQYSSCEADMGCKAFAACILGCP